MKITANDIGRKVRLRNGDVRTIIDITESNKLIGISEESNENKLDGVRREPDGRKWQGNKSDEDIVSFIDEPQTLPIIFQLGDIVSFGGIEGVVDHVGTSTYPVSVNFNDNVDYFTGFTYFTPDGKYHITHTEPLLKLISRPKKKVKKEVAINVWYSPSLGFMSIEKQDVTIVGDSQLIKMKGEIEVEE